MTSRADIKGRLKRNAELREAGCDLEAVPQQWDDDLRFLLTELARVEAERDKMRDELAGRPVLQTDWERLTARFEDMARRVKELIDQCAACGGSGIVSVCDHVVNHQMKKRDVACWICGDVRLALQTETHDGK